MSTSTGHQCHGAVERTSSLDLANRTARPAQTAQWTEQLQKRDRQDRGRGLDGGRVGRPRLAARGRASGLDRGLKDIGVDGFWHDREWRRGGSAGGSPQSRASSAAPQQAGKGWLTHYILNGAVPGSL